MTTSTKTQPSSLEQCQAELDRQCAAAQLQATLWSIAFAAGVIVFLVSMIAAK
jgi:hypothetical protein